MNIGITTTNKKGDIMKNFFAIILSFVFCFLAASCSNKTNFENETTKTTISENTKNYDNILNQTPQKDEFKTDISDDLGGADLLPRKYRNNYYSIPTSFINIVGKRSFEEWEDVYLAENYPDDSNEMVMVAYIKAFDIPKEKFERANLEYAKFIDKIYSHICLDPQDYADQEFQEIYNTEIIYTFDNDIINEYYLGIDYPFLNEYQYDEAIADGTYKTRTTEFITLEQMETEIIAKYGEAEIITETMSTISEGIVTTDLSQTDTTK